MSKKISTIRGLIDDDLLPVHRVEEALPQGPPSSRSGEQYLGKHPRIPGRARSE